MGLAGGEGEIGFGDSGSKKSGRGDVGGELLVAFELGVVLRLLGVFFLLVLVMTMLGYSKVSVKTTLGLEPWEDVLLRLVFFLCGMLDGWGGASSLALDLFKFRARRDGWMFLQGEVHINLLQVPRQDPFKLFSAYAAHPCIVEIKTNGLVWKFLLVVVHRSPHLLCGPDAVDDEGACAAGVFKCDDEAALFSRKASICLTCLVL
jgi:hypothetical protein